MAEPDRAHLRELLGKTNGLTVTLRVREVPSGNMIAIGEDTRAGQKLIVVAVNALPTLLDQLDAAEARVAALEAGLAEIMHLNDCARALLNGENAA